MRIVVFNFTRFKKRAQAFFRVLAEKKREMREYKTRNKEWGGCDIVSAHIRRSAAPIFSHFKLFFPPDCATIKLPAGRGKRAAV
jgi:hypothetical protein